jgi:hypothetical protein
VQAKQLAWPVEVAAADANVVVDDDGALGLAGLIHDLAANAAGLEYRIWKQRARLEKDMKLSEQFQTIFLLSLFFLR